MIGCDSKGFRDFAKRIALAAMLSFGWAAGPALGASFDCERAAAPDEKAICADRFLNDEDVRMVDYLDVLGALQLMGANGAMRDDQRDWLKMRQSCGADRKCLAEAYRGRIDKLLADFQAIARQRQ